MDAGAAGVTLLDFFEVATSRTITQIEIIMVQRRVFALDWRIFEALPAGANYYLQQQAEKTLPLEVSFGRRTSAAVVPSASSTTTIDYPAPDTFVIAQRVTTKL